MQSENFRKEIIFNKFKEKKLYITPYYKIITYSHALRGYATSCFKGLDNLRL